MEAPDIISHNTRLNSVFYLASGAGPHPVVLLLHGFPGNEQNMDLAYAIRRAGWNVFVPHYRGSWGSDGKFSFSNAIEDTQSAIAFLRDPTNAKKYRTDPAKIAIVGHSMGGFLGLYATAHDHAILGMAAISAWNLGPSAVHPETHARTKSFHDASPRLAGTTPEGMLSRSKTKRSKVELRRLGRQLEIAADLRHRIRSTASPPTITRSSRRFKKPATPAQPNSTWKPIMATLTTASRSKPPCSIGSTA